MCYYTCRGENMIGLIDQLNKELNEWKSMYSDILDNINELNNDRYDNKRPSIKKKIAESAAI